MGEKIDEVGAAELLWKLRSSVASTAQFCAKSNKNDSDIKNCKLSTDATVVHSTGHSPLRMPLPVESYVVTADPTTSTNRSQGFERRSRTVSIGSVIETAVDQVHIPSIGSVPSLVSLLDPAPMQVQSMRTSLAGAVSAPARDNSILLLDHHDWRNHETSSSTREVIVSSSPPSSRSTTSLLPEFTANPTRILNFSQSLDDVDDTLKPVLAKKKLTSSSGTTGSPKDSRKWQSFVGQSTKHPNIIVRATLRRKFNWKQYPELEKYLLTHREEYFEHSARNYTAEQRKYNNDLTRGLLDVAAEEGYVFEEFTFPMLRDRIRCYYKSYSQAVKKKAKLQLSKVEECC